MLIFQVRSLVLPENGELFFGSNTTLGQPAQWQCMHPETERRVIPQRQAFDFFDLSNWRIFDIFGVEIFHPRLDVEKVPGDQVCFLSTIYKG
jgi:hypothetical protein